MRAYRRLPDDEIVTPLADVLDEASRIAAARRDVAAFAPIYETYAVQVYRFCYRQTGDDELANDLTAQIFVRAIERLDRYKQVPGATFRSWLFTIARNALTDHWRRRQPVQLMHSRASALIDSDPGPEEVAIHRSEVDDLRRTLDALPSRQREIVELRLAGLTTGEVANAMAISIAAVKSAQTRAYSRIRDLMNDQVGGTR